MLAMTAPSPLGFALPRESVTVVETLASEEQSTVLDGDELSRPEEEAPTQETVMPPFEPKASSCPNP